VTTMGERFRPGGLAPSPLGPGPLAEVAARAAASYAEAMDRLALHEAAAAAYRLVDATNEFIATRAPWVLARDAANTEHLDQVLYDAAEAVRVAAVLLLPVMPGSCADILRRIGEPAAPGSLRFDRDARWKPDLRRTLVKSAAMWPRLDTQGSAPPAPAPPPRIEVMSTNDLAPTPQPTPMPSGASSPAVRAEAAMATPATATGPAAAGEPTPAAPGERLGIDEFMRIELRVARILGAERVPKSKKLIRMQIDVGTEQRTIVAGIAEAYEPEALVGRSVVIVANLKPATLMGIESNGMVLAASPDGGRPQLLLIDGDAPAPGTRVR